MIQLIRQSIQMVLFWTVITGIAYPVLVTGIAQGLFHDAANGSLIEQNGHIAGSRLIGQPFDAPNYFWSRPSATGPFGDNSASSTGSNLGPLHPDFQKAVDGRVAALKAANPNGGEIPVDLVTASASGLDPHISPEAALYQVPRIAAARGVSSDRLHQLIAKYTDGPQLGVLGNAGVNVLLLNRALDNKE